VPRHLASDARGLAEDPAAPEDDVRPEDRLDEIQDLGVEAQIEELAVQPRIAVVRPRELPRG